MKFKLGVNLLLRHHYHGYDGFQNTLKNYMVLNFEKILLDQLGFYKLDYISLLDNLQNAIDSKECEFSHRVLIVLKQVDQGI